MFSNTTKAKTKEVNENENRSCSKSARTTGKPQLHSRTQLLGLQLYGLRAGIMLGTSQGLSRKSQAFQLSVPEDRSSLHMANSVLPERQV